MRTQPVKRKIYWFKVRHVSSGTIWLIVALYLVLTLVYVPA
jgi:hypothetical protein